MISFVIPAIRTHWWVDFYNSIELSCGSIPWELILATPFSLPNELQTKNNIKVLKSYKSPSAASKEALVMVGGTHIIHSTDDALFVPGAVEECWNQLQELGDDNNIINLRYTETIDRHDKTDLPLDYWKAHTHPLLRQPGVPSHYNISLQFLIKKELLKKFNAWDCVLFDTPNLNLHDLMFRAQHKGISIVNSKHTVVHCSHQPELSGDHSSIHMSNMTENQRFIQLYSDPDILNKRIVTKDDYLDKPDVWAYRFDKYKLPSTYEEL